MHCGEPDFSIKRAEERIAEYEARIALLKREIAKDNWSGIKKMMKQLKSLPSKENQR